MATKTPRIQVTLSEEAYRIVDRMADLQRSHRSTIVAEVINDLAPVMGQLLDTMEAAAKIREENIRGVRDASLEAVDRMQVLVDEAEDQFSLLDLVVRRAGADLPPSSNTGATDPPNPLKSHKRTPSKKGAGK
jgi:hypothetical protein